MYRESYKLVENRIREWNPGNFPLDQAKDEYLTFTSEVIRAYKEDRLMECLELIVRDFCPGVGSGELSNDTELLELHNDLSLILER